MSSFTPRRVVLTFTIIALLLPSLALAQSGIQERRVQFSRGATSAKVTGTITGYQTIDYLVNARRGQDLKVTLSTRHGANYFNVMEPGETDVAIYNSSGATNSYEGTLARSGDYRIRVYLMRSAARRNETANYTLTVGVTGKTSGPAGDALVPGTSFHATGPLPCSMGKGQPTVQCQFGVTREGSGTAMVTVTKPDGGKRVIFFERGRATGYDASQADMQPFRATREGDMTIVWIGAERYEIIDAIVFGG
jgi:hypothetical protein